MVRGHCELQNRFILRVLQLRSPQKVYPTLLRHSTHTVDQVVDLASGVCRNHSRTLANCFILEYNWHGEIQLDQPPRHELEPTAP